MKVRSIVYLLLFASIMLCSCDGVTEHPLPAQPSSATVPDLQNYIHVDDPDNFILFSYHYAEYNSELDSCYVPLPRTVPPQLDVAALNALLHSDDFIYADRWNYTPDRANLEFSITVTGDLLIIDLAEDQFINDDKGWVGGRSKGLRGLANAEVFTMWATIRHNCSTILRVQVLEGGKPYVITDLQYDPVSDLNYSLGFFNNYPKIDNEGFIIDIPLVLPVYSVEELSQLRSQIPFSEVDFYTDHYVVYDDWPPLFFNDPLGRRLSIFLTRTDTYFNRPPQSFTSIEEADPRYLTEVARYLTPYAPSDSDMSLVPLYQTVCSPEIQIKEHVEQTARSLFGADAELRHGAGRNSRYDEYGGTYTWISAFGLGDLPRPVIIELNELDDRYELTVVYVRFVSYGAYRGGYYKHEGEFAEIKWLQGEELTDHCYNALPQHRLTLLKQPDDRVSIYAWLLPD